MVLVVTLGGVRGLGGLGLEQVDDVDLEGVRYLLKASQAWGASTHDDGKEIAPPKASIMTNLFHGPALFLG